MKKVCIMAITAIFLVLLNSCILSPMDRQGVQNVDADNITMSDADKQALLEEKFKDSPFVNDTTYNSNSLELISNTIGNKLYCWIKHEWYGRCILQYTPQTNEWITMRPIEKNCEPMEHPYFEEFRLKGNHLYCKYFTGQCGLGLEAIAFEYLDLQEGEWHFITYGTEMSEFVGDSIMADVAWITKQGTNGFDTEYEDSIKWIKMK